MRKKFEFAYIRVVIILFLAGVHLFGAVLSSLLQDTSTWRKKRVEVGDGEKRKRFYLGCSVARLGARALAGALWVDGRLIGVFVALTLNRVAGCLRSVHDLSLMSLRVVKLDQDQTI